MIMNKTRFLSLNSGAAFLALSLSTACGNSGTEDGSGGTATGGSGNHGTGGSETDASGGSGTDSSGDGGLGGSVGGQGGVGGAHSEDPVELGTAGDFVILSKAGISTVPPSVITGSIGVSPIDSTAITGFSLIDDAMAEFATSAQVTGRVFAADYDGPTPAVLIQAVGDMETAFTDAAGRSPDVTELGAGDIGGMTLPGGVYKWGTGLLIPMDVTLLGDFTDVWVFQIAQDLTVSEAASIELMGGALPQNVFWQVAGSVGLGTTSHLEGIVLSQTSVTLATGASLTGRVLAQTAVVLDTNVVLEPSE